MNSIPKFPLIAMLASLVMAVSLNAGAHENHAAEQPAGAQAAPKPLKPKRDPQAYFSDRLLLTQDGAKVRFYSDVLKGRMVVISTFFTNCGDACPLITEQLKRVSRELGPRFGKEIFFVSISSDPARDSVQALKKYAAKNKADGPGWIYLTGNKIDTDAILKKLGAWSEHVESHSTQLIAWNFNTDKGRKMLPNLPPEAIAQQLNLLLSDDVLPLPVSAREAVRDTKAN